MGIDLTDRRTRKGLRKSTARLEPASPNPELRMLVRLYRFLARRTDSKINEKIAHRLIQSKRFKSPISVSRLANFMEKRGKDKIGVVTGTVTDDIRYFEMPSKLTICALRFTEGARKRIVENGGECITFDQLSVRDPKGERVVLLRGPVASRLADKHFGRAPGTPGSHTRPYEPRR